MLLFSSTPCPKGEKGGRELTCAGILFFFNLLILEREEKGEEGRERERERKREGGRGEKETSNCCSIYLFIHWLIFVCALTGDGTFDLGISGHRSNQLSYLTRASAGILSQNLQEAHTFPQGLHLEAMQENSTRRCMFKILPPPGPLQSVHSQNQGSNSLASEWLTPLVSTLCEKLGVPDLLSDRWAHISSGVTQEQGTR